jgi:mono/diheme cytochrome c family protein
MRLFLALLGMTGLGSPLIAGEAPTLLPGRQVPDIAFTDLGGKPHRLANASRYAGMAIALSSSTCPVSKRQMPSLAKLEQELSNRGIALLVLNPMKTETDDEIRAQVAAAGVRSTVCHDATQVVARALQARTTTEVFLLAPDRTLVYRGALDDQYGPTFSREAPTVSHLLEAADALKAGRKPRRPLTEAPGCELDLGPRPDAVPTSLTYHRDIARILQQHCVDCHRPEGIAPFRLDTSAAVTERAKTIRRVVTEGQMPPWFAAPPPDGKPSPWANDCALPASDRRDLLAWLDSADRPLGDPADAPKPRTYPGAWSIGLPDAVLPISRPHAIKADGFMRYEHDTIETSFPEDRWVQAYEILPTARGVVHHVIVRCIPKGKKVSFGGAEDYWAAYVPGNGSHVYPTGFARKLPAGATLTFQIHYTPNGQATTDQLKIGLRFAKSPPRHEMRTVGLANLRLDIPPGAARHVETLVRPVPVDLPVTALMAHMHVRGAAFRFELLGADGSVETLLDLPRYDFNWQIRHDYAEPRVLPQGSRVRITAVFDNSAANPANPDPTRRVRWGEQTTDEMMIGYVEYYVPVR